VNELPLYDRLMRTFLEREVKLELNGVFELPELPGRPLESRVFTSTYYDTPVRSLARVGITLRRRLENGVSRWQVKLPRGGVARAEIEALGGPVGPPSSLAELLVAHERYGPLEQIATLRTRRTGVRVADGERSLADVTLDIVEVLDGGKSAGSFVELEVELVDGDDDDLRRLSRKLRRAGAHRSDGRPKIMRLIELPARQRIVRKTPALEQLRLLLEQQLRELERHDPGVRLGDDAEDLHRYRVATRRSRALIRATRGVLGDNLADLASELKWLAGLLGPVRDLDVMIEHLRESSGELGPDRAAAGELIERLAEERARHRDALLAGLAADRFDGLLARFDAALALLRDLAIKPRLGKIAARELRKLRRDAGRLPKEPTDDQLHALRKRAKHARYAAELAALSGSKAVVRYVEALKALQETIGEHQDAVVAEARLRAAARARTALAAGRLIEAQRSRRRAARAAYPAVLGRAIASGKRAF
jgi:CHAD domain-containing protein/adenylate cyclase class IV